MFSFGIHVLESRTQLLNDIQEEIKKSYSSIPQSELEPNIEMTNPATPEPKKKLLQSKENFQSLFLTIVWFLEHEPYTDIAMNLDVNYRRVLQENYKSTTQKDKDIYKAIMESNPDEDTDTFQNSPLHFFL